MELSMETEKYELLHVLGVIIPCCHDNPNEPNDDSPSSSKKLNVRLVFNVYESLIYYRTNGRQLVSIRNIPTNTFFSFNPFCPSCRKIIAKYLLISKNCMFIDGVNNELKHLSDEVWCKLIVMALRGNDCDQRQVDIYEYKLDFYAPDRVCDEEEFRAWSGKDFFEEEIPIITGLEKVSFDDDGEFLKREDKCGICLQKLKIMDNKEDEDLKIDNNDTATSSIDVHCNVEIKAKSLVKLPCEHVFHEPCVLRWLHNKCVCPFCRFELEKPEDTDDDESFD